MSESDHDPETMSVAQHLALLAQMGLSVVPVVGPLVEKSTFGVLQSRRENRVLHTLKEIAERLERVEQPTFLDTDQFRGLLEDAIPLIAASTREHKRRTFRDLLLNAAVTAPSDDATDEAELAMRIISEIDAPGLALLAAAATLKSQTIMIRDGSPPSAFGCSFEADLATEPTDRQARYMLNYSFDVLDAWRVRFMPRPQGGLGLFQVSAVQAPPHVRSFRLSPSGPCLLVARWGYWSEEREIDR